MIVHVREAAPGELAADRREALRYLGYGRKEPDEAVAAMLDSCEAELLAVSRAKAAWTTVKVAFPERFAVDLGFGTVRSTALFNHLQGCHSAVLFAATIGIGADRLVGKWSRLRPSRSALIDALGSSAIEAWCDLVETEITRDEPLHCDRFSPGYGDFALEHQRDFAACLNMDRTLGITLADSLLMTPVKSVTAVIGLGAASRTCGNKCMFCEKHSCIYRDTFVPQ